MSRLLTLFTICFLSVQSIAQRPAQPPQDYQRGRLISQKEMGSLTAEEIKQRMNELPDATTVRYGVKLYAITYSTLNNNKPANSSGLLIVPDLTDTIRLLTYLHGTEIPSKLMGVEKITPSLYKGQKDTHRDVRNMGLGFASAGYVVFMPDYIGFGVTLGKDHPYLNYAEMFVSNLDGLRAVKAWLTKTRKPYNNNLYITGWSQGAGACLSMHRFIEEKHSNEFHVVASSGLAGPYNFFRFAMEHFQNANQDALIMPLISWSMYAINKFSDISRPTLSLFRKPVLNQMFLLLKKEKKPAQIFQARFIDGLVSGRDKEFLAAMRANSFYTGWTPKGLVFLHHGDADPVVPYFNSVDALNGLQATGGQINLTTYPGGKHDTELGNFIRNTIRQFSGLTDRGNADRLK